MIDTLQQVIFVSSVLSLVVEIFVEYETDFKSLNALMLYIQQLKSQTIYLV